MYAGLIPTALGYVFWKTDVSSFPASGLVCRQWGKAVPGLLSRSGCGRLAGDKVLMVLLLLVGQVGYAGEVEGGYDCGVVRRGKA